MKVTWFCLWKTIGGSYLKQNRSDLVFSNPPHFLKICKFIPGHVTKMCSVNFWHPQDSNSLFNGSIGYVTSYWHVLWKIKITPIYYLLHVEILFPFCALPIAPSLYCVFHMGCVHFPLYFFLFPTKPAAKNRSYSLTCIFSGCASSSNRILQLFTRSTWKINSHLYFEEFSKCDRTYPTGMNHGAG